MSNPIPGTEPIDGVLTSTSVYGSLSGAGYGVIFGAFAGVVFYITVTTDLSAARRLMYFLVSCIAGILYSRLVSPKLAQVTGCSDKPLDAIGAVIASALVVKILAFLDSQSVGSLVMLMAHWGDSGGTERPIGNF